MPDAREPDVSVDVRARERPACLVTQAQGIHLSGYVGLDDAHADAAGALCRTIGAPVRNDDDVELARRRAVE